MYVQNQCINWIFNVFLNIVEKTSVASLTLSSRTLSNPTSGQIKSQIVCFLNAPGHGLLSELT